MVHLYRLLNPSRRFPAFVRMNMDSNLLEAMKQARDVLDAAILAASPVEPEASPLDPAVTAVTADSGSNGPPPGHN